MHILLVHIHVKRESIEAFREATLDNARNSLQEPGVAHFDVLQNADDPARFLLVEVYRNPDAHSKHRETAHYQRWRDRVADMMAEPRTVEKYLNVHPDETGWD